jgi:TPR repeat protein
MKPQPAANIPKSVLNPSSPWKLPRRKFEFPIYPYKTTAAEWRGLLGRAEQGDAEAQWEVAERYFDGCKGKSGRIVVKRSPSKGREWLQRAAKGGCAAAQNHLGVLVGNGEGFVRDRREALMWLKRAFRGTDRCAASNVAITYRESGNFRRAVLWFRKSVAFGDDSARIQLGIYYYWGIGVRRSAVKAIRCFRKAANGRNLSEADRDDSFFYLAIGYLDGNGVKASAKKARRLLRRANVDNDHPAAYSLLSALDHSMLGS